MLVDAVWPLLLIALASPAASPVATQTGYVHGVFVGTPAGPIELIAWAELTSSGQLRMASATLEDVPTIADAQRVLCNLPNWKPGLIFVATEAFFKDERAERRQLPFSTRRLDVSAVELRIAELERADRRAKLLRDIGATENSPGYLFVGIFSEGLQRYYPVRLGFTSR